MSNVLEMTPEELERVIRLRIGHVDRTAARIQFWACIMLAHLSDGLWGLAWIALALLTIGVAIWSELKSGGAL